MVQKSHEENVNVLREGNNETVYEMVLQQLRTAGYKKKHEVKAKHRKPEAKTIANTICKTKFQLTN